MRTAGAVIAGYIVMFAVVFVSFTAVYLMLGTERSFKPESFDASTLWVVASLVLGFIAAILGGITAAAIGKSATAPKVLAAVVVVLGLLMAIPVLTAPDPESPLVRSGDLSNLEAMQQAKQPNWLTLVNPFLGAVGVMVGAGMRKNKEV